MTARDAEIARYVALYAGPWGARYRTTTPRLELFAALLAEHPDLYARGLLDVGAGTGRMLCEARALGVDPAEGTEVVPALCRDYLLAAAPAWALPFPDGSFGTVTCFDVLEHLLPEDVPAALRELARVASARILVEVSCRPSNWCDAAGQLHMTIWPPDRWAGEIAKAWAPRFTARVRADRGLEPAAVLFEGLPATSGARGR